MNTRQHLSPTPSQNRLNAFYRLAILMLTLLITATIVYSIMWRPNAAFFPTSLTINREKCEQLGQAGIALNEVTDVPGLCTMNVPFRANPFDNGGVIYFDNKNFDIENTQVLSRTLIDEQAATQSRLIDLAIILACTGFLLGTLHGLFKL
ncbi:MAG: hypothetical protein B7Y56_10790 [Gallionellales bacterium 35-53-114]|jgi:hypothetical protein|nr:MAG: hypothetical protein B7Y56_10790 [Gallionellales bacterium 35-53-114]OYZ64891.1 MAG: hypothetical protein B7Y04_03810 [Gallionellales bacterium 24-53-125]OZB07571.1 MAG: hypothetical protein B7X61_13205 [Gallionellales bacterium 39-52-133]HQS58749.1 hypothetical protein [Gallionellaceae bacterium]HQS75089.1 hypothetical protein [Gallionellaceae bacterium]